MADLRQKLAALTTEVVKTEDELTTLESDGQLNFGATPTATVQIPRTPASRITHFVPCSLALRLPAGWFAGQLGFR
ncbi:MAG: hypothetical protein EXS37_04115 [Opitutus sp.]|nr:hypothetical protein [Opitutus sp.]